MEYMSQFGLIAGVTLGGELIRQIVPLPVPSSVWGLILMLVLLMTKIIKVEDVGEIGQFLIQIMPLMFIPAAVGLINSWEILQAIWFPVIFIVVVTTILVMVVAGKVTEIVLRKKEENE